MDFSEGLVGPKGMVKTVPDGHTVNIPWLTVGAMGWRSTIYAAPYWIGVFGQRVQYQENPVLSCLINKPKDRREALAC